MVILAEAKEKVDSLTFRALERVTHQELRRQNNIDAIVEGAVGYLPDSVSSVEIDEDWIINFFNLGQDIGNPQMQKIWSKLLAGEVSHPGTFNSRTIQAVKSLSVDEANLFTVLCGFSFVVDGDWVLPVFSSGFFDYIRDNGLDTLDEVHLQNIGLLSGSPLWYGTNRDDGMILVEYHSTPFLAFPEESGDDSGGDVEDVYIKAFPFTKTGMELARIAGGQPDSSYIDLLCDEKSILRVKQF